VSAATLESIRPYVELLVAKAENKPAPVFALATEHGWDGPAQVVVANRFVDVRWCPSELAIREALLEEVDAQRALLVLTPVTHPGDDVVARLFGRRVVRPDPLAALAAAFDVQRIDARIPGWLVRRLVALAPAGGYERTGARMLDAERAWSAFFSHALGLAAEPALPGLLEWASSGGAARLAELDSEVRGEVVDRLAAAIPGAAGVLAAVTASVGDGVVALGLALRPLVDGADGAVRVAGRVHLSHNLNGWAFDELASRAWADAAEARVRSQLDADSPSTHAVLQHADRWVARLGVEALAGTSDVLSVGLSRRLAAMGAAIDARTGVAAAAAEVRRHRLAVSPGAAQIAEMSRRLVDWLDQPEREVATIREAAAAYAGDSAYADLARTILRHGGGEPALDAALRRIVAEADARRGAQERRFAELLAAWSAHAVTGPELLGVEDVLGAVVVPLAAQRPILVVVLDGMSHRVAAELLESLLASGWTELRRAAQPERALVIAALPSVTTYSRASLLSGTLTTGLAADEQSAFASYPGLAGSRLFHKRELADPHVGLAAPVREAIDSDARVVGAVVNAIDDHLARDDQLRSPWSVHDILPLRWLLEAARDRGRLVVLLADHGHVLERGGRQRSHGGTGGERWAAAVRAPDPGEVLVEGVRVLAGGGRALLACDEDLRYGPKKHGYHGGATAQEVLAPALVLAPTLPEPLRGFAEAPYDAPAWWTGVAPTREPAPGEQLTIEPVPARSNAWIDALLASETYAAQRRLASRSAPADERVHAILVALDAHGGTMLRPGLAQAVGIAPARLSTTLAMLRLLLNVEGYDGLEVDEQSDTVRLNANVLSDQFGLPR
jgi:hypothetical protein